MNDNDRVTEIPENREAYEFAACAATAPSTIPPEAVEASDPYEFEGDNLENIDPDDYESPHDYHL